MRIKNFILSKEFLYFFIITIVLSSSYYYFVSFRIHPDLFFDEYYYLQGAFLLSKGCFDCLSRISFPYSPLYSIFLSPFVLFDLCDLYPKALVFNSIILFSSVIPLYFLFRKFKADFLIALFTTLLVLLSPSLMGYSMASMSEALFIPIYIYFSAYFLFMPEKIRTRDFFIIPLFAVLLIFTKKSGISISVGLPLVIILLYYKNNLIKSLVLSAIVFTGSFFSMYLITQVWHLDGANQSIGKYSSILSNFSFEYFIQAVIGQLAYIHIASGMLLPFAIVWCIQKYKEQDKRPLLLFLCSVILMSSGIIHMVCARLSGHNWGRYLMYGRYVDYFVPLVIFMGGQAINNIFKGNISRSRVVCIMLIFLSTFLILFLPDRIEGIWILNMGVGWIVSTTSKHISDSMIFLSGIILTILPFLKRYLRKLSFILPFVFIIYLYYVALKNIKDDHIFYQNNVVGKFIKPFSKLKSKNKKISYTRDSFKNPGDIFMLRYYLGENVVREGADYFYSDEHGLVKVKKKRKLTKRK